MTPETFMTPRQQAIEAMARAAHEAFCQMWPEWEAPLKWSDVEEEAREEARQNSAAQLDALLAELPGMGLQVVPVVEKLTREMWAAAGTEVVNRRMQHQDTTVRAVWAAMCAVAPNVLGRNEP